MSVITKRFQFLLLDEFAHAGLYLMTEPMFLANWLLGQEVYTWAFLSMDGNPVRSSSGMLQPVEGSIDDCRMDGPLFVMASFSAQEPTGDRKLLSQLRRMGRHGFLVGGIEMGSEALAKAGLLNGYRVAVHWENKIGFQERFPDTQVTDREFEVDRNRITSVGAVANMHLALHLIEEMHGAALVGEICRHLHLKGSDHQSADHPPGAPVMQDWQGERRVRQAIGLMKQDMENPYSCQEIADELGISLRQLERDFRTVHGLTPKRYYSILRLNHAHGLLQQTDLSVTEISVSTGFVSSEHFSRAYRAQFGCPPSQDRRQSTDAPASWTPDHIAATNRANA